MNTGTFSRPIVVLAFIGALQAAFPLPLWAAERATVERDLGHRGFMRCGSDPVVWNHKVPVPGLAHSAPPAFPQVDAFDGRMGIQNRIGEGKLPQNAVVYNAGVSRQDRNRSWYRRTFRAAGNRAGTLPLRTGSSRFRSVCLDIKSGSYPRSLEAFRTVMNRWGSKEISGRKKTMPPTAAAKQ